MGDPKNGRVGRDANYGTDGENRHGARGQGRVGNGQLGLGGEDFVEEDFGGGVEG